MIYHSREDLEHNIALQKKLRIASEHREAKAHQIAASLDEIVLLLLMVLQQAANTPRGMQARRARRLLGNFQNYRMDALEGKSVCRNNKKVFEPDESTLEHTNRLVR